MSSLKSMVFILLILAFLPSSLSFRFLPRPGPYDPSKALDFWYYAIASYCSPTNIQSWSVSTVAEVFPYVQEISVFTPSSGGNQAYAAFDADNNLIILSIRGSSNIQNWIENLDVFQTAYDQCEGCEVHTGFHNAYLDLSSSMIPAVIDLYYAHPFAQIAVVGHSLGAAIATFAFIDISQKIGQVDYFYTYGSPRVGNSNFANFVNSGFHGGIKARLTHYQDPVPHLPLESMGFLHIDREIYYVEDSSSYIVCATNQEDINCANQFSVPFSVPDHVDYMAFSQPNFKDTCKENDELTLEKYNMNK